MSEDRPSRLTQSFVGLDDKSFHAVPNLQRVLTDAINKHIDQHHVSMGTVVTALACVVGELVLMAGDELEQSKLWFLKILDEYVSDGPDGARTGPGTERSLIRKFRPWFGRKPASP